MAWDEIEAPPPVEKRERIRWRLEKLTELFASEEAGDLSEGAIQTIVGAVGLALGAARLEALGWRQIDSEEAP